MDYANSWKPDPYRKHELRFFSADGRPTPLVMDAGKRSFDRPSASDVLLPTEPVGTESVEPERLVAPPSVGKATEPQPAEREGVCVRPPVGTHGSDVESSTSELTSNAGAKSLLTTSTLSTRVEEPLSASSHDDPITRSASVIPPVVMVEGAALVADSSAVGEAPVQNVSDVRSPVVEDQQPEAMGRPMKIAYAAVLGLLALSVVGVVLVHFAHSSNGQVPRAESATTTTSDAVTTTTAALPTTLSSTADAAAAALVSSWSKNDRSGALTVATPAAVASLFGAPYASGQAIARGCSTSFTPIVCTYGPPGGASPTDPIYQIMVSQTNGGWYVSSVKKEN
jgi:hypothetical protein